MIPVPYSVMTDFIAILRSREIPLPQFENYKKWLRYFYDFYANYLDTDDKPEKVRLFLEKLRSKNQTPAQCQQAAEQLTSSSLPPEPYAPTAPFSSFKQRQSQYCAAGYEEKSASLEWDALLAVLAGEIKVRHYSRNTLKTYAHWSRQFQRFLKNKPTVELSTADVKDYLTYLAVKCNVAASTQNQAFNSLLFLYRHALKREFGELRDVPRAKKSLYIPMVLSMLEIDAILKHLYYPYNLFVKVLFGCGLRLFEGLQIRVGDFNSCRCGR